MGGLCQTDATPEITHQNVLNNTDIPEWVSKGGQEIFEQSKLLAQEEYPAYDAPRVADTSGDEQASYGLVRDNAGAYTPFLTDAQGMTAAAGQGWNADVASEYMNPYQKNVTDIAANEMRRNADIRKLDLNAAAPAFGAFGSARHGVLEAEMERNLGKEIGEMYAKGQAAGYENASQRFDADRTAKLASGQQMGALGNLQSTLGYQDADMLMRSGEQQRKQEQRSLDTAYGDFLEQREWPYRQVNFSTGVLKGVPYETKSTQQGSGTELLQQPSTVGQVAGLGLTGAAIGNMAGFWGN